MCERSMMTFNQPKRRTTKTKAIKNPYNEETGSYCFLFIVKIIKIFLFLRYTRCQSNRKITISDPQFIDKLLLIHIFFQNDHVSQFK